MRNILLLVAVLGLGRLMADVEYLYTNGVWTSFDKCRLTAEYLEREYLGESCGYVHNPSHGRIRDSVRAVLCWFGATHPIVDRHVRVIEKKLAGGGTLVWIVHSEGVLVADQVLDRLPRELRGRIQVHAFGGPRRIAEGKAALVVNYVVPGDPVTVLAGGRKVGKGQRVLFDPTTKWAWPVKRKHRIVNGRYEGALKQVFGSQERKKRGCPVAVGQEFVTCQDLFVYRGADEARLGLEPVGTGPHVPMSVSDYRAAPKRWAWGEEYRKKYGSAALYHRLDVVGVLPAGTRLVVREVRAVNPPSMGEVRVPLVVVADGGSELLCARFLFGGGIGEGTPLYPKEQIIGRDRSLGR